MRSSLLAALLLVAGCGPGVHDLTVDSAPIAIIRGKVDFANLKRTDPDAPLVAALVWAGKAYLSPVCVKYAGDPKLKDACPDPYGVFIGVTEVDVPVDPSGDGTFEMKLARLPYARVSVGDAENRIAYGTLILAEDRNRDGHLTLGEEFAPPPLPGEDAPTLDQIVAASFYNLNSPQQRLVFREGEFDAASYFYPVPECPTPPKGFSVLKTQGMGIAGGCTIAGLEEPIELQSIVDVDDRFGCRVSYLGSGTISQHPPPDEQMGLPPNAVCIDAETLMDPHPRAGNCVDAGFFRLKGCWSNPYCEETEWDLTSEKPSWWPCN